jgi:hypothetical protein
MYGDGLRSGALGRARKEKSLKNPKLGHLQTAGKVLNERRRSSLAVSSQSLTLEAPPTLEATPSMYNEAYRQGTQGSGVFSDPIPPRPQPSKTFLTNKPGSIPGSFQFCSLP